MGLILAGKTKKETESKRTFECMGNQFVLVTITMSAFSTNSSHLLPRPFHWRLADGKNPPLDISIDPESGLLREITFFIEGKIADQNAFLPSYKSDKGQPVFQIKRWGKNEYYLDEEGMIDITLYNNDIYCIFSGINIDNTLDINKKLICIFDNNNVLGGFILKDLDKKEKRVFKDAGLI